MKNEKQKKVYTESIDVYSSTKSQAKHSKKNEKGGSKKVIIVLTSIVVALAIVFGGAFWYLNSLLNNVNRGESFESGELGVHSALDDVKVVNIALFGIDTRSNGFKGRSDAVMVLTIDKENDKIKMTSIARDSYVEMNGHDRDKLTHAYAFGGAKLAMKTVNQNYDLNITDYITVNFFGITEMIDAVGGVTIDVNADEMRVMNAEFVQDLVNIGIPCEKITKTGLQRLTGAQALAYSRNRYTGGDSARTGRQREVLSAMFDEIKKMGVTKLPGLIKMALQNCETSLTNSEITSVATWALTNSPKIESLSLPDKDCNEKQGNDAFIGKIWYSIYDLDVATQKIHDFIKEEGTYVPPTE